ncbi:hypothetical protein [Algoriphagus boritolerans]|uniref:Uncharacterized protein n=1 Tax=Algoriphagus boritolerans DSM 17298 = JCM 18970 TaxID=1120964 RepID=A0A1H6ADU1_9BACT|nr:hypothetical protein [Algoriphagus boritolerans]SEG46903.1 hypothetical protein SAMN03080598_04080 [Algoriphagus boritolerans DSM 17298 = JCM 18970]
MNDQEIGTIYRKTERLTLLILMISLPLFGMVYLYDSSGNLSWDLPKLPSILNGFLIGFSAALLIGQYVIFHKKLKSTFVVEELLEKVRIYSNATNQRFWILFLISVFASVGLLFNQNPVYTVIFAVTLIFFSLAKPSPDRMARLMKLKKEDRERIRAASRPQ